MKVEVRLWIDGEEVNLGPDFRDLLAGVSAAVMHEKRRARLRKFRGSHRSRTA